MLNALPSEIIIVLNVTITIVDIKNYIKSIRLKGVIVVTVHFTHAAASHAHSRSYNENQWWLVLSVGMFYSKLFFRTYDCLYTLVTFDFSFQKGIFTQILISTIRKYLSHSVMRGESKHTVLSRSVSYNSEICPRNNSFQNLKKLSVQLFLHDHLPGVSDGISWRHSSLHFFPAFIV